MEEVAALLSSSSKDKAETVDRVVALLPAALSDTVDDGVLAETVQGLGSWLKSSNPKVHMAPDLRLRGHLLPLDLKYRFVHPHSPQSKWFLLVLALSSNLTWLILCLPFENALPMEKSR